MPTLAPKLPWTHAFAGGYPRVAGQALFKDPDAIDYLERVKAADGGVGVEVAVAMAVDDFFKGLKADGTWSAIKASCIMCGARTISGALVPLAGAAPTGYGDWASGDYDRSSGLKGNGSTKYLDTNRANNADGQNDNHMALYVSERSTTDNAGGDALAGVGGNDSGARNIVRRTVAPLTFAFRANNDDQQFAGNNNDTGFVGMQRQEASVYEGRSGGATTSLADASQSPQSGSTYLYRLNWATSTLICNPRLAFYSIGSSLDLAALDNRVSTLVTAIAAAI